MIDLLHFQKKNKYGYNTYWVKLDNIFKIVINEANPNTYIIEFVEAGVIWNSTHFTFTSNQSPEVVLEEALFKVFQFFRDSKSHDFDESKFKTMRDKVLGFHTDMLPFNK